MNWQSVVERTVTSLGYDPVDIERGSGGLLRVTIDTLPPQAAPVNVDDCEKVTRELQTVLEVEGIEYARLEVSSPGVDRPLKKPADWQRFAGSQVELTLREPLDGRRRFIGVVHPHGEAWQLVWSDGKDERSLDFELGDVREARLVPVLDFKPRRSREGSAAGGSQR